MDFRSYKLTTDELERCFEFSRRSAETQQAIEFGQRDTKPRSEKEIMRDNMIGKLAEVAIARMVRGYGIHVVVNFDIYGRGEWDDCDLMINGWKIDIKSTRSGRWMLFEKDKLMMRKDQHYNNVPDAIFMCRTVWDKEHDLPTGDVELIGAISLKTLLEPHREILRLSKGECIPNTKAILQADNYAVRFEDLNHEWWKIIDHMAKNNPPDREALSASIR